MFARNAYWCVHCGGFFRLRMGVQFCDEFEQLYDKVRDRMPLGVDREIFRLPSIHDDEMLVGRVNSHEVLFVFDEHDPCLREISENNLVAHEAEDLLDGFSNDGRDCNMNIHFLSWVEG